MCVSFCLFVMSERACACLVRKSALHKLMLNLLVQHEKSRHTKQVSLLIRPSLKYMLQA